MKTKLQALIAEQKALTARFEELLHSTTEESSTLDPKKVYIKGHPTRGAEVIKMLEDLGGVNFCNYKGVFTNQGYFITDKMRISSSSLGHLKGYTELHLPEEVSEVNTPTKEVELIEGEVYCTKYGDISLVREVINKENVRIFCVMRSNGEININSNNGYTHSAALSLNVATPEQKQQLFDALEKAGKHFDKENMRLLDVEEWSCEQGFPFIRRIGKDIWKCDIFWQKSNNGGVYAENGNIFSIAIPYNNQTKHLVGTNDSPDKHYKFVSE